MLIYITVIYTLITVEYSESLFNFAPKTKKYRPHQCGSELQFCKVD